MNTIFVWIKRIVREVQYKIYLMKFEGAIADMKRSLECTAIRRERELKVLYYMDKIFEIYNDRDT